MSAGQLIVVTVALGLAGGFAIWFGEQESRPLLRYGGAASLVGAIALVLMAGPPHLPPGPASRVAAPSPTPTDTPSPTPTDTPSPTPTDTPSPTPTDTPSPSPSDTPQPSPSPTESPSPSPSPSAFPLRLR